MRSSLVVTFKVDIFLCFTNLLVASRHPSSQFCSIKAKPFLHDCYKSLKLSVSNMVQEIDGSILEGGGQIVRISIALSVLQSTPVHIKNIRAGRKKGGLAAQHLKGVQLAQSLCNAKLNGDELGSMEVVFKPEKLTSGKFLADTGTAGSTGLLLQVSLPCLLFSSNRSYLTLKGGTNAEMAPQIDYTLQTFRPNLQKFGADFQCSVERRGFFPVGNGIVNVEVEPIQQLNPVNLVDFGQVTQVRGEAFVAGVLPFKMAEEMAAAAENVLRKSLKVNIAIKPKKFNRDEAFGNGSGINLVAETSTGCFLGGSKLGQRGTRNDEIGKMAAEELLESINRKVCVDQHTQDLVIIFMALANGKSRIKTGPITLHTKTAIHMSEMLTPAKFSVIKVDEDCNIIECEGIAQQGNCVK